MLLATLVFRLSSPVAVAAATLAAAALFSPMRRQVQRMVDRRFNRARYNADTTVAAFAARLKDAVDLDTVRDDLASVVQRALEPAHVSVWTSQRDRATVVGVLSVARSAAQLGRDARTSPGSGSSTRRREGRRTTAPDHPEGLGWRCGPSR